MRIKRIDPDHWRWLSENTHKAVFAEVRPEHMDRVAFVLLALDDAEPVGYLTVQERDHDTAHLQYGGVFPPERGRPRAVRAWQMALNYLMERYKQATMFVANDNRAMLKLGLALGFKVVGMRLGQTQLLLEHRIEFNPGGV